MNGRVDKSNKTDGKEPSLDKENELLLNVSNHKIGLPPTVKKERKEMGLGIYQTYYQQNQPVIHETRWDKIFISHQRKDSKTAKELKEKIEAKGVNCYLDITDPSIKGDGETLEYHIRKQMNGCEALLAVVSRNTESSWWVPMEIGGALAQGIPIGILLIGKTKLPSYLKRWEQFNNVQDAVDWATNPNRRKKRLQKISWDNHASELDRQAGHPQ